jgi:excisionase family DNA binding protein
MTEPLRLSDVRDEDVLTPKQVACIVGRTTGHVRHRIYSGELPAYRIGPKNLLLKGEEVKAWAVSEGYQERGEAMTEAALGFIEATKLLGTGAPEHIQRYVWPCVYFVGEMHRRPDAVKIGRATNALKRLASLQCSYPFELRIWALAPGADELEYHRKFHRHRIRGEWFRTSTDVVREIKRINEAAYIK